MKFATYVRDGSVKHGALAGDMLYPLSPGRTMPDLLGDGLPALLAAGSATVDAGIGDPLREVRLLAPVSPGAIRDYTTFEQHVEGMLMGFGQTVPETFFDSPTFYFSNPYAVTGPYDDIPIAPGSERFDYEVELAAVIGPAGKDLTVEQAREHIIGYTVFNDWSARDIAERELKNMLGPAKAKDTASTFGPYLVTADEVEPRRDPEGFLQLEMTVSIGDQLIGKDTFANMAWTFEELVAHASRGTWVRPGDVIGSGTCGSGCLAEMWGRHGPDWHAPLRAGDQVTATIELIGELRNRVAAGSVPALVPAGRAGKAHRPADIAKDGLS